MKNPSIEFNGRPSVVAYMLRALYPDVRTVHDGVAFSLTADGSDRPAFLGQWSGIDPGTRLLETPAGVCDLHPAT